MELRDGDLVLRPWTEDDVPALVEACNDAEIAHWIPVIPRPYTEADALAFVRGEARPEVEHSYAIAVGDELAGATGMSLNTRSTTAVTSATGSRHVREVAASVPAPCSSSRSGRWETSDCSASS